MTRSSPQPWFDPMQWTELILQDSLSLYLKTVSVYRWLSANMRYYQRSNYCSTTGLRYDIGMNFSTQIDGNNNNRYWCNLIELLRYLIELFRYTRVTSQTTISKLPYKGTDTNGKGMLGEEIHTCQMELKYLAMLFRVYWFRSLRRTRSKIAWFLLSGKS